MRMHDGRDAGDGAVPGDDDDGWELFGSGPLDGLSGLVGDGRDARYVRGAPYTAALREAKSSEKRVLRVLRRNGWLRARVVTQSWCTAEGEPVVRVEFEMTPQMWARWAAALEECERRGRGRGRGALRLRGVPRGQRRDDSVAPSVRRAWSLCPKSLMWAWVGARRAEEVGAPRLRDAGGGAEPG